MTLTPSEVASIARQLAFWEIAEYASEAFVALGCFGEYVAEYTKWLSTEGQRRTLGRRSLIVLILGISFGLLSLIQTNALSGEVIGSLGDQAKEAGRKAAKAIGDVDIAARKAQTAVEEADTAKAESGEARKAAVEAESLARGARQEAAGVKKDVIFTEERLAHVQAFLTPRSLNQKEMTDLRDAFRPLADPNVSIVVHCHSMQSDLGVQVWRSLVDAGFKGATLKPQELTLPSVLYGFAITTPVKYLPLAEKIGSVLLAAKIGPMIGTAGKEDNTAPIRIMIGDVRTAPLPMLR